MWRPKEEVWNKLKTSVWGDVALHTAHEEYLFEAGADAILEALKDAREVSGYWCFIPEEE